MQGNDKPNALRKSCSVDKYIYRGEQLARSAAGKAPKAMIASIPSEYKVGPTIKATNEGVTVYRGLMHSR